jgi:hypothetical protein
MLKKTVFFSLLEEDPDPEPRQHNSRYATLGSYCTYLKVSCMCTGTCVLAMLPVTLDTPMNRKWMPKADT